MDGNIAVYLKKTSKDKAEITIFVTSYNRSFQLCLMKKHINWDKKTTQNPTTTLSRSWLL